MITAFVNLKGGCGKSTSAVHLCRYLLQKNKQVALVDADAQATSSSWINNLEDGILRPDIFRITEPDPILDELPDLTNKYDEVVFDGAGGLAEVQRTILLLADLVIIPIQPSIPDVIASHEAIKAVRRARKIRQGQPSAFTVLTRVISNTLLLKEAKEVLQGYSDVPLVSSIIPQRQIAADVMGQGKTLFDITKNKAASILASSYRNLFEEVGYG